MKLVTRRHFRPSKLQNSKNYLHTIIKSGLMRSMFRQFFTLPSQLFILCILAGSFPDAANAATFNLVLKNGVAEPGGGACQMTVNSKCRFRNVVVDSTGNQLPSTNLYQRDVIVTITSLSSVTLDQFDDDTSTTAGANANYFQPIVNVYPVTSGNSGYAHFRFEYVTPGTNTSNSLPGTTFVTALDVDGANGGGTFDLREFVEVFGTPSATQGGTNIQQLSTPIESGGTTFRTSSSTALNGIAPDATNKVTAIYNLPNTFDYDVGASLISGRCGTSSTSTACARLGAISFQIQESLITTPIVDGYKSVRLTNDADSSGTVTPGDTITWTLTYVNTGNQALSNFQITDSLPNTVTFTTSSQQVYVNGTLNTTAKNSSYNGSSNTNLLATNAVTLSTGGTVRVEIPVTIQAAASSTTLSNQATASGGSPSTDNVDGTTVFPPSVTAASGWTTIPANSISQNQTNTVSPTTAAVVNPIVSISGKVWNDADNSANNTFTNINTGTETGTNAGGLNAILVNASGNVIATTPVATDGTYNFSNVTGNQNNVTIRLSTTAGTVGSAAPAASVPANWTNTSPLTAAFNIGTTSITAKDFGIRLLPNITVTKNTSTSNSTPGGTATYTITVSNATGAGTVDNVTITDPLPKGFIFNATSAFTLSGSASRNSGFTNPASGSASPSWNNFKIPGGGSVTITFTVNIGDIDTRKYDNSANVTYTDVITATSGTATYNGSSSTAEDVTLTVPPLSPPSSAPPAPPVSNARVCGLPGKDGVGALSGIVNTYYPGLSSVSAGSNSISLGSGQGATTPISKGDLLLVIQMQDATIDYTNTSSYGSGNSTNRGSGQTSMGQSGKYEYVVATADVPLAGGTLTFQGKGAGNGLIYNYVNANATATNGQRRFQIVRVPQYASVSLTNTLTSLEWNGTVGGIVALDVVGQLNLNSRTIDAVNRGFRAGYAPIHGSGGSVSTYVSTSSDTGAGKGEGTAGTPRYVWNGTKDVDNGSQGYPGGDAGKGAPANAGGGGNVHNAGGGGGGNGGIGGQGGLPWEGSNGPINAGGRPGFPSSLYTPTPTLLLMGGGGGGGDANNASTGVRGGVGGGITILRAGTISGTGTILANGDDGDRGAFSGAPDGAGGGGAGGTVMIAARNSGNTATINVEAKGGKGGNTANDSGDEHGPGGGGGGGVVLYNLPGGTITASVAKGASGKANDGAGIPHGASDGTDGQIKSFSTTDDPFSGVNGSDCLPALTVTKATTTPKVNLGGIAKYKISVTNASSKASATDISITDTLPNNFTYLATDNITLTGGATQTSTTDPTTGATVPVWDKFTIPADGKVEISFQVTIGAGVTSGTYQNSAIAKYPDPTRTVANGITQASYDYANSNAEDVTVNSNAQVLLVKRITAINGDRTKNPNDNTPLNVFVDDTTSTRKDDDNNPMWKSGYLLGAIDAGKVKPGDEIEYTVYFLNPGGANANSVRLCDRITANQDFKVSGYGTSKDMQLQLGTSTVLDLTSANDSSDRAQFISAGTTVPTNCYLKATNDNGTLMIDVTGNAGTGVPNLTTLPGSTAQATPNDSYGFFRFITKVKP